MPRSVDSEPDDTTSAEVVTGKIMVAIEPLCRGNISEHEWMVANNKVIDIIKVSQKLAIFNALPTKLISKTYGREQAKLKFGGHCGLCRDFDPLIPCATLDKTLPGCVRFTALEEVKREKLIK